MARDSIVARSRLGDEHHSPRRKRILHYRAATALAGGLLAMLLVAAPATAQETSGGVGGGPAGGAGGASSSGSPGGAGANGNDQNGGGGGGAGTNGGAGGSGGDPGSGTISGGAGGVGPGGDGSPGTGDFLVGASGGGGGAHGYVGTTLPLNAATGGRGGEGGDTGDVSAGGGGGAGGYGAVISGTGDLGLLTVAVTGGAGGSGGTGGLTTNYGAGGQGGHGLVLSPSTLTVGANISGGGGGQAFNAPSGLGGYGIVGSDLNVTIGAAVSGGLGGDGVTRAYALFLTGGDNVLTFGGGSLAGGIRVAGGSLTLDGNNNLTGGISLNGTLRLLSSGAAGGAGNTITTTGSVISYANGTDIANPIILDSNTTQLDVPYDEEIAIQSGAIGETGGARPIEKIGPGTLILTGANTYTGGTTITDGRLQIGNGGTTGNLGGGDIVNDGTLVFNRSDDITVSNDMFGSGNLLQLGPGTLTLTGFNEYVGVTTVLGGTLAFDSGGLFGTSLIEIGNGAGIRATDPFNGIQGDIAILDGGGTIDTGAGSIDHFGSISFGGELTKAGSGLLLLEDGNDASTGDGGINVLAGTLALGTDNAAGTGRIRLADGTTLANAACFCGALSLDNDIEVALGGTATLDGQGLNTVLNGQLSGGSIRFVANSGNSEGGGSIFYLNGANEYTDTIIGPDVAIVLLDGTLGIGNTSFDPTPSNPFLPMFPALVFANTADYNYGGRITGDGMIEVSTFDPATTITLSGSNTTGNNFTGTVTVTSGRLNIDGNFGDIDNLSAALIVDACSCLPEDATLGGSGSFFGNVTVNNGTLAVGNSPGTLNVAGNLTLGAGTILNFEFGQPGVVGANVNDFVTVGGNLTIDGTLNIIDFGPSYGPGYYALFRYGGTLTDNSITIGSVDSGLSTSLLFNIPGQINLLLGPQVIQYWDGADTTGVVSGSGATNGNGGAGTWNASNTNWTAATGFGVNDSWRSTVGVFAGAAGTVTVAGTQTFQELRFQTNNYVLQAGAAGALSTTGGFSIIDVSDGITADIRLGIGGTGGLTKTGAGTLILSAGNSYAGATEIQGGTLRAGANGIFLAVAPNFVPTSLTIASGATFDLAGTLQDISSLSGNGSVLMGGINARLGVGSGGASSTFGGTISGGGTLQKVGAGTLTLGGSVSLNTANVLVGGLTIGAAGSLTATSVNVSAGASFSNAGTTSAIVNNSGTFGNSGVLNGLLSNNAGTTTNSGTINGNINNFASFISTGIVNGRLTNEGPASIQGQLNGDVRNRATLTLTGATTGIGTYEGLFGSVFNLASFSTSIGALTGTGSVQLGAATLTVGSNNASTTFAGVISGNGGLTKIGAGTLTLSGANSYAGLTTVSNGTLQVASGGSLTGDVLNQASFVNSGTVGGTLENSGTATNSGTIGEFVNNSGTFTTTGIVNPLISGLALTNNAGGTVNAQGQINGLIQNSGTFNVTGALTGITRFNQFGTAALNLQNNNLALGGLSGSGTVALGTATLTVGVGNLNSTYGGVISGSGGLTKVGTDIFTLSGQNTYTGTTLVSHGTLRVSGSGNIAGPVVNNATLENFATIAGQVSNNGTYTQVGALNGALINNGTASIRGQLNGNVDNQSGNVTLTGALTGIGAFNQSAGATFNLAGLNTAIGALSGDGSVQLGTATLTVGSNNSDTTFAGIVTGSSAGNGLTKVGTGTLTLSGANSYAGLTTISNGTLEIASGGSLVGAVQNDATFSNSGDVDGLLTNNGNATNTGRLDGGVDNRGTLDTRNIVNGNLVNSGTVLAQGNLNGSISNTGNITLTGFLFGVRDFTQGAGGLLDLGGTTLTIAALNGLGTIRDGSLIAGTGGAGGQFDGAILGGGLTKVEAGTLILGGANTANLNVSGGTLILRGSATGSVANSADFRNDGVVGGLVQNFGGATTLNNGTMSGGVINDGTFRSTGIVSGNLINRADAFFQGQLNGSVEGRAGIITMTGTTTGIGRVTMSAGALFDLNGFNTTFGSLTGDGQVALGAATLTVGSDNADTSFAGIVTGSGAGNGLTKIGTGTLTLSGANTYTGTTNVSAGTLTVTSTGRISGNVVNSATFNNDGRVDLVVTSSGTATNSGTIANGVVNTGTFTSTGTIGGGTQNEAGTFNARGQINGFVVNRGVFNVTGALTGIGTFLQAGTGQTNLNGNSLTVGALQGDGGVNLGTGNATLTTGNASNVTFFGSITGTGNLTKVGTGTLVLAGANSFTGLTTVSEGTLGVSLTGSLASPVLNNATLLSDGTINGLITNNATFASTGTINGGLTNNGTAQLRGQLNGPVDNQSGSITLTGTLTGLAAFNQAAGATFNLANFNATIGSLAGNGSVQLGTGTLTVGGNNISTNFAGEISGNGQLVKVGTGTLTLSGANTYTGTTDVSAGTLTIAAGGSLASSIVGNSATLLNAGLISGFVSNRAAGSFTNSGTAVSGVLNAGTLSSTGIIGFGFENTGTAQLRGQLNGFVNNNAGTITLTGALTGITTFSQAAGATLNLNGFSLSIGTLAGAGSITFGAAAAPASASGFMPSEERAVTGAAPAWLIAQDSAQPEVTAVAPSGVAAATSATGAVSRPWLVPQDSAGPGEAALASRADLTTGGAVSGGNGDPVAIADSTETALPETVLTGGGTIERLAAAPAAAAAQPPEGIVTPNALPPATGPVLTVGSGNVNSLFAGVISGNGRLAKVGTGTLILTGNNTYTDGTLISGGVLQLGNGGTSGSIVGRIENNATLIVNRSDALTLSGIIDGTGLFVQAGTGTTTLTGANAYTGGTLIQAGRLRGDVLSIQGDIQNNATLEFAQGTTATFSGRLFGAGAVEKTGGGLLTFATDNSNLTGGTTILAGELRVTGLLSRSRVTVGNGATLSGTSVVGGIVAQSGGTVAPGAGGFGTLGVNGNVQFLAGSTFAAQVQPAGSDLILGNGTAQLAGTIAIANAGGVYRFNSVYVLLQADAGRAGTFGLETGLNTFGQAYAPRIVYTPTQVQLLLAPAQLLNIAGPDGTPNQRSTLTRIDAAVAAGYDPQPLIALYSLTPRAAFLNGADQLSGEIYATSVRVAIDDERLVREAALGRLRLTQDMAFGEGFGAWGQAVGSWGSGDSDGNAARYETDRQGFVVGVDGGGLLDGGSWRLGLLGHHVTTDISVDARGSNAEIERTGGGIYGGLDLGSLRIRAGGIYSSLDLSGRRVASFTGFTERLTGETDGEAIQGFADISYRLQAGTSAHVEAYAQAAFAHVEFDAFSETGGASRLRVAAEEDDLAYFAFGLRGSALFAMGGDTRMRLDANLGGRLLSGDRMIFSLISLEASPNQAFDIRSAAADRFAVTGALDATFELSRAVSFTLGYSGVFGANSRDHAARATLGIRF